VVKKMLIAIGLLALASPALGMDYRTQTVPELLQRWVALNRDCRGDNPATTRACDERHLVGAALFARGYCYVGMGATSRWEKGPASRWTRRREQATCAR
jgi:hypothetical protein